VLLFATEERNVQLPYRKKNKLCVSWLIYTSFPCYLLVQCCASIGRFHSAFKLAENLAKRA